MRMHPFRPRSFAGVSYSELRSAGMRLGEVDALQRPLLQVLEKEELVDKLAPLLVKHKVRARIVRLQCAYLLMAHVYVWRGR